MKKSNKHLLILGIIFLVALFLRIYNLETIPHGFHADELDAGYIGRYILLHGKDIFNNPFPLFIDKFGDFRPAGIFYVSGISTFLFGVNEFAVRFPVAFFGALTVVIIFYLTKEIYNNKTIAYISSIFLALLPWHIVLSRATSEAIVGEFLTTLGIIFLFKYKRIFNKKFLYLSFLTFLLSYFFYHSFRLLIPLIILPFIFSPLKKTRKGVIILFIVFSLLSFGIALTPWGGGRFNQVAFYKNTTLNNTIESLTHTPSDTLLTAHIFHNKVVIYGREFAQQYLSYFSPQFLFLSGGLPWRYVVPEEGLLYISFVPLFVISLLFLAKNPDTWNIKYLFYLLLISPLPAALTYEDSPNVNRSIFLIIPLMILISYGFYILIQRKKIYSFLFAAIFTLEVFYFLHMYFYHTPFYKTSVRNDGNKELVLLVEKKRTQYKTVFVPEFDNLPLYYLFFTNNFNEIKKAQMNEKVITNIGNIVFVHTYCPSEKNNLVNEKNILVVENAECMLRKNYKEELLLRRNDTTRSYRLISPNL